jgi:DNA-directed RNA polymerase specialized sigma24 family protein
MTEHNFDQTPSPASGRPSSQRATHFKGMLLLDTDEPLLSDLASNEQAVLRTDGSYEERARKLNVPLGTLRSRLHRARAKLVALRSQRQSEPQ